MRPVVTLLLALFVTGALLVLPVSALRKAASAPTTYVQLAGDRIGYRSIGTGTPILMLTRFRGTLDTWDPLFLDGLANTHRVITVDYPGVGYSGGKLPADVEGVVDFVKAFATKVGLPRFAVLGWSWGGIAAQAVLLRHPAMISHAVLIATGPPGRGQAEVQPEWLARAVRPMNDLADEEILFFEPKSAASLIAAKRSHDRIYARAALERRIPAEPVVFQSFFEIARVFKADADGRLEQLKRSQVPILIISGDNDPSVPATNWYPLIGKIPRAQITVLPQSGHGPQHQYPALSVKYIKAFLQERW